MLHSFRRHRVDKERLTKGKPMAKSTVIMRSDRRYVITDNREMQSVVMKLIYELSAVTGIPAGTVSGAGPFGPAGCTGQGGQSWPEGGRSELNEQTDPDWLSRILQTARTANQTQLSGCQHEIMLSWVKMHNRHTCRNANIR